MKRWQKNSRKPVCIPIVLYLLMPYIRKPENIWSFTKLYMMAVLMGSMLSLIRYLPDQQRCSFQKSIMKNIPISNRNTDSKDFSKSQGNDPLAFLFPNIFYILRISDKFLRKEKTLRLKYNSRRKNMKASKEIAKKAAEYQSQWWGKYCTKKIINLNKNMF